MAIYNPGSSGVPMPSYSRPTSSGPAGGSSRSSTAGGLATSALGGLATGGLGGALIGTGSQLAGAALGNKGNKRAMQAEERARQEAMAYQREQDAKEEARYLADEAKKDAQWAAMEAEAAPYRQAAEALLGQNAGRLGLPFSPSARPAMRPVGWTPGSSQGTPRTLSALAGTGTRGEQVYDVPVMEAPKLSLSDVINSRWGARS